MFSKSFLLFHFLLCPLCFDLRILPLSVVPLPAPWTHLHPAPIFCLFSPDMFLFALCWCFSTVQLIYLPGPTKVQTALLVVNMLFPTHTRADQNICCAADKWKFRISLERKWAKKYCQQNLSQMLFSAKCRRWLLPFARQCFCNLFLQMLTLQQILILFILHSWRRWWWIAILCQGIPHPEDTHWVPAQNNQDPPIVKGPWMFQDQGKTSTKSLWTNKVWFLMINQRMRTKKKAFPNKIESCGTRRLPLDNNDKAKGGIEGR